VDVVTLTTVSWNIIPNSAPGSQRWMPAGVVVDVVDDPFYLGFLQER
jgi:hypothetical protein